MRTDKHVVARRSKVPNLNRFRPLQGSRLPVDTRYMSWAEQVPQSMHTCTTSFTKGHVHYHPDCQLDVMMDLRRSMQQLDALQTRQVGHA
jgi:hypothetical protein